MLQRFSKSRGTVLQLFTLGLTVSVMSTALPAQDAPAGKYALVLHGGAGRSNPRPEAQAARLKTLEEALDAGVRLLEEGAAAVDVVEAVVRVLEDSPAFNAGHGAVLTANGEAELDAAIMEGRTHRGGAVGGVTTVKNPITLARAVMEETPHLLLSTVGAEKFADEIGAKYKIERVPNSYFIIDYRREELERVQRQQPEPPGMGTVGCVALDQHGNLAAATSTGGLVNKRHGRFGDTPILGAGTYADNATCAVSGTGVGEDFIRYAVAYDVSARMRYLNESLEDAVKQALHHPQQQVRGGLIGIDRSGRVTMQFNTPAMSRAAATSAGLRVIESGP